MAERFFQKMLLVEGEDDKRVIPHLMEANSIPWGDVRPVEIKSCNGFEEMAKQGVIETELKSSGLLAFGLIADANSDAHGKWTRLRPRFVESFPNAPEAFPEAGLVLVNDAGLRLGVWLMPDNRSCGMMETFLTYLVRDEGNPILAYAAEARDKAKSMGALFKDTHADKAKIHTWLAWQDPPGRQLHDAVKQRILDPHSPHAAAFVTWFRNVFDL